MFGDACQGRERQEGEELCPNAVCAHDPALIPEQAHGNMAACTTTEGGEGGSSVFGCFRHFPELPLTALPSGLEPAGADVDVARRARGLHFYGFTQYILLFDSINGSFFILREKYIGLNIHFQTFFKIKAKNIHA